MELKEMEIRNPRNEGLESPRFFFNRRPVEFNVQNCEFFFFRKPALS